METRFDRTESPQPPSNERAHADRGGIVGTITKVVAGGAILVAGYVGTKSLLHKDSSNPHDKSALVSPPENTSQIAKTVTAVEQINDAIREFNKSDTKSAEAARAVVDSLIKFYQGIKSGSIPQDELGNLDFKATLAFESWVGASPICDARLVKNPKNGAPALAVSKIDQPERLELLCRSANVPYPDTVTTPLNDWLGKHLDLSKGLLNDGQFGLAASVLAQCQVLIYTNPPSEALHNATAEERLEFFKIQNTIADLTKGK